MTCDDAGEYEISWLLLKSNCANEFIDAVNNHEISPVNILYFIPSYTYTTDSDKSNANSSI
jgi:hypothetical protein